jgi:hypothetical protein
MENKEDDKHNLEDLFDYIASEVGFDKKELIEAIKMFGRKRHKQGGERAIKKINKHYNLGKEDLIKIIRAKCK